MPDVALKRAYDAASASDGLRVLVDRLWPRGISRDEARIDAWLRDLAPSDELRRWFHARPAQWLAFRKRYLEELHEPSAAAGAGARNTSGFADTLGNCSAISAARRRCTCG